MGLFAATVTGLPKSFEKLFHLRLHRRIHLDERRPRAFEAFAGEFLGRVDAEFAADAISLVAWSSTSDGLW